MQKLIAKVKKIMGITKQDWINDMLMESGFGN